MSNLMVEQTHLPRHTRRFLKHMTLSRNGYHRQVIIYQSDKSLAAWLISDPIYVTYGCELFICNNNHLSGSKRSTTSIKYKKEQKKQREQFLLHGAIKNNFIETVYYYQLLYHIQLFFWFIQRREDSIRKAIHILDRKSLIE